MNHIKIVLSLLILLMGTGISIAQPVTENTALQLKRSLTFYASFDDGFEADFSEGDPKLYVAPGWGERMNSSKAYNGSGHLELQKGEGRYGDALLIENDDQPVYFYRGENNVDYSKENWETTVSFWLRLSPDEDLADGYSDPIQITASAWNDGALFVDFTDQDPRRFRFAFFADREVWDPEMRDWDDIPVDERPMVEVDEPFFSRDSWVHIAFSIRNFNTGKNDGLVHCYINGKLYNSLEEREQTFTWNPEEVAIWLGYNFIGFFDELAIFNRALTDDEIANLYSLENGIRSILHE